MRALNSATRSSYVMPSPSFAPMVPAQARALDPARGAAEQSNRLKKGGRMAHPNVELLQKGYDAFEKGDLDTLRELFAADIVFHTTGHSPLAGDYRGQDEVFGFFGKLVELTGGTFKIERHAVLADDEHGAVL